jgi:hypothetical protein
LRCSIWAACLSVRRRRAALDVENPERNRLEIDAKDDSVVADAPAKGSMPGKLHHIAGKRIGGMASSAAMMRSWSAAGTRLRFLPARLLTATAQFIVELAQVGKAAFAKFLAAGRDRGDILGCRLLLPKQGGALLHRAGVGSPNVVPQRLAHEFGARAMLFPAHAFEFVRHPRRQGY